MTTPETASFAEFAALIRAKRNYVTELRKVGRLVLTEDGKRVRVPESLELIASTRDPSKAGVVARHAAARAIPPAAATPPAPADEADTDLDSDGEDARPVRGDAARRAKAMADKEEALAAAAIRENRIAAGELMDAQEVDAAIAHVGTALRKDLERLPDVLAPQLVPLREEHAIRALVADAIEEALRESARRFAAIARQASA